MALEDPSVAIAGCGLGGAALALALQRRGVRVRIFERDADLDARAQGYGLTLQQGRGALEELGVPIREGDPGVCTTSSHFSFDSTGDVIGCYGRGVSEKRRNCPKQSGRARKGRHNICVPRQELRRRLVEALAPGTVVWGAKVTAVDDHGTCGGGATVHLEDGSSHRAILFVGADGLRSLVAVAPLRFLNLVVVLGIAPCSHPLLEHRITQTLDGSARMYTMPFMPPTSAEAADGLTMWQFSYPATEEEASVQCASPAALLASAQERCGQWHDPLPSLLESTPLALVTGYPIYERDVVPADVFRGRPDSAVTLIGDASHAMSPFKGQGANQALLDAVLLARSIAPLEGEDAAHAAADGKISGTPSSQAKLAAAEKALAELMSEFVEGDSPTSSQMAARSKAKSTLKAIRKTWVKSHDRALAANRAAVTHMAEASATALQDGWQAVTSDHLLHGEELAAALTSFEAALLPRARAKVAQSRESAESLHTSAALVRCTGLTRAAAAKMVLESVDSNPAEEEGASTKGEAEGATQRARARVERSWKSVFTDDEETAAAARIAEAMALPDVKTNDRG